LLLCAGVGEIYLTVGDWGGGGCVLGDFAFSSVCQQRNLYAPRGVQTSGLTAAAAGAQCVHLHIYRVQLVCARVVACIQRTRRLNTYTTRERILYYVLWYDCCTGLSWYWNYTAKYIITMELSPRRVRSFYPFAIIMLNFTYTS